MKTLLSLAVLLVSACSGSAVNGSATGAPATPGRSVSPDPAWSAPSLDPSSSTPATGGGLHVSPVGFTLRLPDGWTETKKIDELQLMGGVVFVAAGPNDQALTVSALLYSDPAPFPRAFADQLAASGAKVDSVAMVDEPAGGAARVVFTTPKGTLASVAIGGGHRISSCRARPAGYLLMVGSTSGGPPDEVVLDAVAASLVLDKQPAECPSSGLVWSTPAMSWSSAGRFGKFSDHLFVLMAMPGYKFIALGSACPQPTPDGAKCPVVTRIVAWLGSARGQWQEIIFPEAGATYDMVAALSPEGVVAVQTSAAGGAVVWSSVDGRKWVKRSVIGGEPGCTDLAGSPHATGVQIAKSFYYVTGDRCVGGKEVPTIYLSKDLHTWTTVDRIPADGPIDVALTGLPEYAEKPVRIDSWYVSFEADAGAIESWGWLSPDGAHWRELAFPSDIGDLRKVAGRDGTIMFVSSADAWDGFEARIVAIQ